MGSLRSEGEGLRLAVTGEQWWWRVSYSPEGGGDVVHSANEIRLPAGRRAELLLDSPAVINSFWLPPLAGKMDIIPGRPTRLVLEPAEPGHLPGAAPDSLGAPPA